MEPLRLLQTRNCWSPLRGSKGKFIVLATQGSQSLAVGLILSAAPQLSESFFGVVELFGSANTKRAYPHLTRLFRRRRKSIKTNCERLFGFAK